MSLQGKAQRLFEYISHVYSIDLPIDRDVTKYGAELWWQAEVVKSSQCEIKEFNNGENNSGAEESADQLVEDTWLSVTKRSYEGPPQLPAILEGWIDPSSNPTKPPLPKASILKSVYFDSDYQRKSVYAEYCKAWSDWKAHRIGQEPSLPEVLAGWIAEAEADDEAPIPIDIRQVEEKFEDDKNRVKQLKDYSEGSWKSWSERVLPLFKANILYDQLFSLHQRLGVEGDRLEVIWGHLFLSWNHSYDNIVYHPVVTTPMNLHFVPERRNITLTPSQTVPTKLDLDCILDLDYPFKDQLIKYSMIVNSGEAALEAWNHNQMRGFASTITGYLSTESKERTNLYTEEPLSRPSITSYPTMYNAPLIFVRERTRRLWVDDAKNVAEAICRGSEIPPFIASLVADPHRGELLDPEDHYDDGSLDEDEGEHLLPLEYNEQQEEIVKKIKKQFGVLVQGPPGTGKSHTISNIISSALAKGKRVLVTSQTENALRVLRGYIPQEIRSLCVSHLGNDTESKRQLNEAVESIGGHLSERNSSVVEQKIQRLKKELRAAREDQAVLRNQIKNWVKLDSLSMNIDGETISAHRAAKECSETESNCSWFPDKLSPDTQPPLSEDQLREMCSLIKEIASEDRKSCSEYLPNLRFVLHPDNFEKKLSELKAFSDLSSETEELRSKWDQQLEQAKRNDLTNAISILEQALLALQEIKEPWQSKILELMVSQREQEDYWQNFRKRCESYKSSAWKAFQLIQDYTVSVNDLPKDLDINVALEELENWIKTSRGLGRSIRKITLSKAAKLVHGAVTVDGLNLLTPERITTARAHFSYHTSITKMDNAWNKAMGMIDGAHLDFATRVPLQEIDEKIRYLSSPTDWKTKCYDNIRDLLQALGCGKQIFHTQDAIEEYLRTLSGQIAEIERRNCLQDLYTYKNFLENESSKQNANPIWTLLAEAVGRRSIDGYRDAYNELLRILQLCDKAAGLEDLSSQLKRVAPNWHTSLEEKALKYGQGALEENWGIAWRWRRLNEWLNRLHNMEDVESLQIRLERARRKERELIGFLVKERTWQRQLASVKDHHYRALVAWAEAMRKYGRTGGKYAHRWLSAAARAMVDAVGAVPAWIMPLHRVVQSFSPESGIFDLVIVDEASQCDLRALPVLFRAKKVLIVGDPEQISPAAVGIDRSKVFELNRQFLSDIPHADTTFLIDSSLYDISKSIPRMDRTLLTEHFRCVQEIIEFNNHLCPSYAGKLEPLRQPNPREKLEPSIKTMFIEKGFKDNNDINKAEAEALVEKLVACCKDETYGRVGDKNRERTMGVISLLGEKQAKYISELIAERLDETEREERRIICGDAYAFQGDERDVMFLSLVVATNAPYRALGSEADRQRFNVATSRAKDQVFLFHSVSIDDIRNPECVRYKLLNWYLNPPLAEMEAGIKVLKEKADSPFEIEVGERVINRGYKVIPQFRPLPSDFNYRIDLLIQGENNRVAVECDGDRWHGIEKWEHDQRREAQLRRAGWKFWRISGSSFYRNKEKALQGLWRFLDDEGIKPISTARKNSKNRDGAVSSAPDDEDKEGHPSNSLACAGVPENQSPLSTTTSESMSGVTQTLEITHGEHRGEVITNLYRERGKSREMDSVGNSQKIAKNGSDERRQLELEFKKGSDPKPVTKAGQIQGKKFEEIGLTRLKADITQADRLPSLHTVQTFAELNNVIWIRSEHVPTNYMDRLLFQNESKKLSEILKDFHARYPLTSNYKHFTDVRKIKEHIKYREQRGWVFKFSGDPKDPVVVLVGFDKPKQ